MTTTIVSRHLPDVEGTAAGRVLHATVSGMRAEGHDLTVVSWGRSAPDLSLPSWASWQPLPPVRGVGAHVAAVLRPRGRSRALAPTVADAAVAIADDPVSFAAVEGHARPVATLHYATGLDRRALRRWTASTIQDIRAERRATRRAALTLAYSPRVAASARRAAPGRRVVSVPVAIDVPPALSPVEQPTAGLIADWAWPPNRRAADVLLSAWPLVRQRVPGARLILAGRGRLPVGTVAGVEFIGPVGRSVDVLTEVAVLAFPCPPTSGPKVKVLEAMGAGVAVVTTAAGVEGITGGEACAVVTDVGRFGETLAETLSDAARRVALAGAARSRVEADHAPRPAARRRLEALAEVLT